MYTLIRFLPLRRLLLEQAPALVLSLGIAEMMYKFHSFLLESLAFLATWFIIDLIIQAVFRHRSAGDR